VRKYLNEIEKLVSRKVREPKPRLLGVDRLLVCDIDNTLLGDDAALQELIDLLSRDRERIAFAIATGRRVESAVEVLRDSGVPMPDILITAVGSEIHYGHSLNPDLEWMGRLRHRWDRAAVMEALSDVPGLVAQPEEEQREFKCSYWLEGDQVPLKRDIVRRVKERGVQCTVIVSHDRYVDVLPSRASKGLAVEYLGWKWRIPREKTLVAGDSGNDAEMLRGDAMGVVVGNYSPELEELRSEPRVFFATAPFAGGVIEGMHHYELLGERRRVNKKEVEAR